MVLTRDVLTSYTDGTPLSLEHSAPTTLHTSVSAGTEYVYVHAYYHGSQRKKISITMDGQTSAQTHHVLSGGQKNTQLLLPGLPIYNASSGVTVTGTVDHGSATWSFPSQLSANINIFNGSVASFSTSNVTAGTGAQSVLLVVSDLQRTTGDVSPSKGTHAIVELYVSEQGVVLGTVLETGRNLSAQHLHVRVTSGVFLFGHVLKDS